LEDVMKEWDGIERRQYKEDRDGRRVGDQHCGQHDILWRHHDEDTKNHRQHVCGKIKGVAIEVGELRNLIVGKWTFNLVMGFVAAAFLFVGYGMREMGNDINAISVSQAKMAASIEIMMKTHKPTAE
jgi:hypothetical protein